jgi:hypothetical protein
MPVDSPKDIEREEGIDRWDSSNFYLFIVVCIIVGVLLFFINHFYGVPPLVQPAANPQ